MRTTRATAPGSPRPQHGPGGAGTSSVDVALGGAQLELGRDRAAQLAELDRLLAQRDGGVEPAEVEQLARQAREAPQLALGAGDLLLGVVVVERGRRAGPPRAARSCPAATSAACAARARRWRRTRAAPPPGGAAPPASRRARGRGRRPRRGRRRAGVGASGPSAATRSAAARRRASRRAERGRQRDAEQRRRRAGRRPPRRGTPCGPGRRRSSTSVSGRCATSTKSPVLGIGPADGIERAIAGTSMGWTTMTWLSRRTVRCRRVADGASRIALRGSCAAREVRVVDRGRVGHGAGDDDARVGAQAQREGAVSESPRSSWCARSSRAARLRVLVRLVEDPRSNSGASASVASRRSLAAWSGSRLCSGGSSASAADRERDGARGHERGEQPPAQPEAPAPGHCSRKR